MKTQILLNRNDFRTGVFKRSIAKFVRLEFRQQLNNSHGHWISKKK